MAHHNHVCYNDVITGYTEQPLPQKSYSGLLNLYLRIKHQEENPSRQWDLPRKSYCVSVCDHAMPNDNVSAELNSSEKRLLSSSHYPHNCITVSCCGLQCFCCQKVKVTSTGTEICSPARRTGGLLVGASPFPAAFCSARASSLRFFSCLVSGLYLWANLNSWVAGQRTWWKFSSDNWAY